MSSSTIGTFASATIPNVSARVGTSQLGWAASDSGRPTSVAPSPSRTVGTRPFNRGSAKNDLRTLPVLVIWIVAVAGRPAVSFALGELGTPLLVTGTGAKPIEPVNGSRRCAPLTGAGRS